RLARRRKLFVYWRPGQMAGPTGRVARRIPLFAPPNQSRISGQGQADARGGESKERSHGANARPRRDESLTKSRSEDLGRGGEARFEVAAQKLGLEQGIYRYLNIRARKSRFTFPWDWTTERSKSSPGIACCIQLCGDRVKAEFVSRRMFLLTKFALLRRG